MLTKESLIEWAASWVSDDPDGQRARFKEDLTRELKDWSPPPQPAKWCKNCPFAAHLHYEERGKLVAPGCSGLERQEAE